jgi:hypothetical protein
MASVENLKLLYEYKLMRERHTDVSIIGFIDTLIIKVKQDIIHNYVWTEEEIVKKIVDDINPDGIAIYFV